MYEPEGKSRYRTEAGESFGEKVYTDAHNFKERMICEMRKRQWKKILSVVLALAMVFSMNITAFADPAPEGEAIEQTAAEEPVAAPVESNEENSEETKEETKAEEPAAEKPAAEEPAKEPAPAEEAAPKETTEEAVGDLSDLAAANWTLKIAGENPDPSDAAYDDGTSTLDFTMASEKAATLVAGAVTTNPLVINNTANTNLTGLTITTAQTTPVTVKPADGLTVTLGDDTYAYVAGTSTLYTPNKAFTGDGSTIFALFALATSAPFDSDVDETDVFTDETVDYGATIKGQILNTKVADGIYKATGAFSSAGASDISVADATSSEPVRILLTVDNTAYDVYTSPTRQATPAALEFDSKTATTVTLKNTTAGDKVQYKLSTDPDTDGSYDAGTDAAGTTVTITGLTEGTAYNFRSYTPADATYLKSAYSTTTADITPAAPPVPPAANSFTVSGYTFELGEGTVSTGSISTDNAYGIWTIKLGLDGEDSGTVTVKKASTLAALSVNVAKGVTLKFDSTNEVDNYSLLSVEGEGTILVNALTDANIYTKAFESVVAGVTISGNDASILISSNVAGKAAYTPVVKGKDAGLKMAGKGRVVAVALQDVEPKKVETKLDPDNYLLDTGAAPFDAVGSWFVLSGNKVDFSKVADKATYTVSDTQIEGISTTYKSRPIFTQDAKALTKAVVVTVPDKGVSKWINRIVKGMNVSNGIHVDYDTEQASKAEFYEFVLSSNSGTTGLEDAKKAARAGLLTARWQYGTAGLITNLTTAGKTAEPGKDYTLYGRALATADTYRSDVFPVCSFKTLEEVRISVNKAGGYQVSPNYIGTTGITDAIMKGLAGNTNVLNRNFFNFTFQGFDQNVSIVDGYVDPETYEVNDTYMDNKFTLVDSDGYKLGTVKLYFTTYDPNPAVMNAGWDDSTPYYQLEVNNPAGQPYAAKIVFTPDTTNAQTVYNSWDSFDHRNIVSFNIIKAPVKYEPVLPPVVVSGNMPDFTANNTYADGYWKATSKITNLDVTDDIEVGGVSFYIDNKKADSASWNSAEKGLKAGSYTITISQDGATKLEDGDGNYAVDKEKEAADYSATATLKVVDPKSADGLKVTAHLEDDVYFGATLASVKESLSANFTFGGVDVSDGENRVSDGIDASKIRILKSASSNAQLATDEVTAAEMPTVSANTKLYAYYVNVTHAVAGYAGLDPVSTNTAVEITVKPRPVDIGLKAGVTLHSYRGEDVLTSVSTADLTVTPDSSMTPSDDYDGEAAIDATKFFTNSSSIDLDTSLVDSNVPNRKDLIPAQHYTAALKGYALSADAVKNYAQNYVVDDDTFDYDVWGKWYVKLILEYGGPNAPSGKRYVSTNEVIVDDDGTKVGTNHTIKPSDSVTESWNKVLAEGDVITKWDVRRADDLSKINTIAYGGTQNVTLRDYDFAVYAVVAAKATKQGVRVESITPVVYDGMAHVTPYDWKNTNNKDLGWLTVYDEVVTEDDDEAAEYGGKGWNVTFDGKKYTCRYDLVQGTDYTVTYKNNKNASVAYDNTVSGDDGSDGIDPTFKRIVADKKMPQVIIKGKGNYKSLKATVLFDILPAGPAEYTFTSDPALYQFKGKTLSTKATIVDTIVKTWDPRKEKTYKLKAGKVNAKALSGYKGDYVVDVYKVDPKNGTRTKITNFKKMATGTYDVDFKFVNNYYGTDTKTIEVVEGNLLSKQTIKYKKKISWKKDLKASEFITSIKTKKKPKTEIPLIGTGDNGKAGYYINAVTPLTGGTFTYDADADMYILKDAGKYKLELVASNKLGEESHVFGSHTVTVEVKGTKVKAKDFKINDKSAKKTVVLPYNGESEMVKVTTSLTTDEDSKIPTTMPSAKRRTNSKKAAVDGVYVRQKGMNNWSEDLGTYTEGWCSSTPDFIDTGVRLSAALSGRGVYTVSPKAFNGGLFETYDIKIKPSGKYYAGTTDGYIILSYKRGGLDLSKVIGSDIFKVDARPVKVNIGGTPAELIFKIAGMDPAKATYPSSVTVSGDLTNYYDTNTKKTFVMYDGSDILEVTYKNNKKIGTATAVIKPTKYSKKMGYFKKQSKPIKYTIETKPVAAVGTLKADTLADRDNWGEVFAVVNDTVAPKKGNPVVNATLYQVDPYGIKLTKLGKKDFKVAAGELDKGGKKTGYEVVVTDGSSKNFKFAKGTEAKVIVDGSWFNVYGQKAKIKFELSENGFEKADASKEVYYYTGSGITPSVKNLTINGTPVVLPGGAATESSNFIVTYKNNVNVGTATVTVTLKRDVETVGLSGNDAYPYGGSATVKFKIVGHENNKLILSE